MIANRRERILLLCTGLVVGALVLDSLWLTPLLERQRTVEQAHRAARMRLQQAETVARLLPAARTLVAEVEHDLSENAERTGVLDLNQRLSRLAKDAGVRTNKVDLVRQAGVDAYKEVVYRLDLKTDIAALQKLLYLLDTSALPLKISNLAINREPKGNDLKVTLQVSMLTKDTNGKESQ